MQNDFIDGSLGTSAAQAIVPSVIAEIGKYNKKDIFATMDTHGENYLSTAEGRHLPIKHCIKGTNGWKLDPQVEKALIGAEIIEKPTFASLELAETLRNISAKEKISLTLIGLCTDICVVSNALLFKTYMPEVPVRVVPSCCAGVTAESHAAAISTMEMCQIDQ